MTQEELRQLLEYRLSEYMGTENAKNLGKWGTPENRLVNNLMVINKQYVEEIIGEDEESEYSQDNIDISAERNYLKQEQRKRAGL